MDYQFTITESAANRIEELLKAESAPKRLRISISGGGCSGFQYHFVFDDQCLAEDHIFAHGATEVIIDETSLGLLSGAYLDYVEDLVAATFVIKNPNASSACGCGNSFSI